MRVEFFDQDTVGKDDAMFHFAFHTAFVAGRSLLLPRVQVDKAHKQKHLKNFAGNVRARLLAVCASCLPPTRTNSRVRNPSSPWRCASSKINPLPCVPRVCFPQN